MTLEEKYILKLERRVKLLETSASYRITYPLRKAKELLRVMLRLPDAVTRYLQPGFRDNFNAGLYLSSSMQPHGWWRKLPALHCCIFNKGEFESDENRHGKKYDALAMDKPLVVLVSHAACRSGAPVLALDLVRRFIATHNVVVFSIAGGDLENVFRETATVYIGPIPRPDLGFVIRRELQLIKRRIVPEFAVINSAESTEVLDELWRQDVPAVHLVHEFAAYIHPKKRIEKSASLSHTMVFPAEIVRDNALETFPEMRILEKTILPQGICALPENPLSNAEKERERAVIQTALHPVNWPADTIVVLGAGTVHIRKGVDLFISCAKKVREKSPESPIRFVWIGAGFDPENDPYYSSYVHEQMKRSKLGDSFVLLDAVSEFQFVLEAAGIFFLCSRLDPFPLVAQDALANSVPLVCFDEASGIVEHIRQDPQTSFGIVPHLDVDAAADKILRLATDPALRTKIGVAGRQLAEKLFDQDAYFAEIKSIGQSAAIANRQEITDRAAIQKSGCFEAAFSYPSLANDENLALKYYLTSWRTGLRRRKPFPGFHPGIYADETPGVARDPFAHFVESSQPAGPWLSEVITPDPGMLQGQPPSVRAALHIHIHYPEMAEVIIAHLKTSRVRPDLFVSVTSDEGQTSVRAQFEAANMEAIAYKVVPNRGRDIGPLFTAFPEIFSGDYDVVGHVHGKKSVNLSEDFARQWTTFLYENMLGKKMPMLEAILQKMQADASIGIVFPDDPHIFGWEQNLPHAEALWNHLGLAGPLRKEHINFPIGTMFWARTEALKPLVGHGFAWEDFPTEPLPYDGTMLHALERLLPQIAEACGFRAAVTYVPGVTR